MKKADCFRAFRGIAVILAAVLMLTPLGGVRAETEADRVKNQIVQSLKAENLTVYQVGPDVNVTPDGYIRYCVTGGIGTDASAGTASVDVSVFAERGFTLDEYSFALLNLDTGEIVFPYTVFRNQNKSYIDLGFPQSVTEGVDREFRFAFRVSDPRAAFALAYVNRFAGKNDGFLSVTMFDFDLDGASEDMPDIVSTPTPTATPKATPTPSPTPTPKPTLKPTAKPTAKPTTTPKPTPTPKPKNRVMTLSIENRSGRAITEVYFYRTGSSSWGKARNSGWIYKDASGNVTMNSSELSGGGKWSLRIGFNFNTYVSYAEWENVDLEELFDAGSVTVTSKSDGHYTISW